MDLFLQRIISEKIIEAERYFPVTVITGPRQSGKTSLCRHLFKDYKYVNLEDLTMRAMAMEDPSGFINANGDRLILDEVQNVPELLSIIQVKVDEDRSRRYVLSGSCNFALIDAIGQSLAGRASMFTLLPFSFGEIRGYLKDESTPVIMLRGQYPGVIVDEIPPSMFYQNYYKTYVERDIRGLLKVQNILKFDMFCHLLAARVGTELNAAAMAREVGVSATTVNEWFAILAASYIVFKLPPYFSNISKRLTKMPKIYFYDTGLLCYLLNIETEKQLTRHPLYGSIFENQVISEIIKKEYNDAREPRLFFYREHSGREVDAVIDTPDGLRLFEIKSGQTYKPEFAKSLRSVAEDLPDVSDTGVVYDGENIPPLAVNFREL